MSNAQKEISRLYGNYLEKLGAEREKAKEWSDASNELEAAQVELLNGVAAIQGDGSQPFNGTIVRFAPSA